MDVNLEELKSSIDLRESGLKGLHLSKKNPFSGFCPFHQDSNPSLHIYEKRWHCFGCGRGGDIFDWYMMKYELSLKDAVRVVVDDEDVNLVGYENTPLSVDEQRWVESASWLGSAWLAVLNLQDEKNRIIDKAKLKPRADLGKMRKKWALVSGRQKKIINGEFAEHVKRLHCLEDKVKQSSLRRVLSSRILLSPDVEPFIFSSYRFKTSVIKELVWDR